MGYDKNTNFASDNTHKKIWAKVMNEIIKTKQEQTTDFKKPADIVKAKVCKESGKLAIKEVCDHDPRGSRVITEYFEKEPFLPRPVISTLQLKYVKQAINSPQRIVLQTKNKEKFTLSAKRAVNGKQQTLLICFQKNINLFSARNINR